MLTKPITEEDINKEFYDYPRDLPNNQNILEPETFNKILEYSKNLFNFKQDHEHLDVRNLAYFNFIDLR